METFQDRQGGSQPCICGKREGMVVEETITEETKKNAIDLMVTMVVNDLAEEMHLSPTDLLPRFIASRTGRLLYDETSKLGWSGPSDIADMYKAEINN